MSRDAHQGSVVAETVDTCLAKIKKRPPSFPDCHPFDTHEQAKVKNRSVSLCMHILRRCDSVLISVLAILPRPPSTGSSQLGLQSVGEGPRNTRLVGVGYPHNTHKTENSCDKCAEQYGAPAGGKVVVRLGGKDTEDIVVLVDRLAIVAAFLLVPPVAVGITKSALLGWWVGVCTVLRRGTRSVFAA